MPFSKAHHEYQQKHGPHERFGGVDEAVHQSPQRSNILPASMDWKCLEYWSKSEQDTRKLNKNLGVGTAWG
jgi:hypothetical protein